MARTVIETVFNAIDRYSQPLNMMTRHTERFSRSLSSSFTNINSKLISTREHLFALAGNLSAVSLAYMGFEGIKQFDENLMEFSAVSDVVGKDLDKFKEKIMEVAKKTNKSAVDVVKSFMLVGSAKSELLKDEKALALVTEASITLAKASKDTLENSTSSLVGVLNMFNLKATESTRVINALAAGEVVGAARTSQVNESIREFGAGAEMMNVSLEDSIALVEILSQKQIFGAEAGTKLRNIMSKMSAVNALPREAIDSMSKLGINMKLVSDKSIPFEQRLNEMAKAVKDPSALVKIFGLENKEAATILLSNTELFSKWSEKIKGTNTAQQQAEINSRTFTEQLDKLKNTFINLMISGNDTSGFLSKFGGVLGFLTNNLSTILTLLGVGIGLFVAWKTILAVSLVVQTAYNIALGTYLALSNATSLSIGISTTALTAYNIVTKIMTVSTWLMTTATTAFSVALKSIGIGWILIGIGLLIGLIVLLVKNWDIVSEAMKNAFAWMWDIIKKVGKSILMFLLAPIKLVIDAIAYLSGADWAKSISAKIETMTSITNDTEDKEKNITANKTVNPILIQQQAKQNNSGYVKVDINNNNKSNISTQSNMPFGVKTSPTYGY